MPSPRRSISSPKEEISAGPALDGLVGPLHAGSVVVVTGTTGSGTTTLLRHVATQIGQHTSVWFLSSGTEPPRPLGPPADIVWMNARTVADLAVLAQRHDHAPVWILDDAHEMPAGDGGLASHGWARTLPLLRERGLTLLLGMKRGGGGTAVDTLPRAIAFATSVGLELDVVIRTRGGDSTTGVVADVRVWKSRHQPTPNIVGRAWLRPLHEPSVVVSSPEVGGFLG